MSVYSAGEMVRVRSLGKDGSVERVLGGDRYRVAIGSMLVTCRADELAPSKHAPRRSKAPVRVPAVSPPPSSVDLHGLTVADAIRTLEERLDRAVLARLSQLKVIHGLWSDKVQRAVHDYLATLRVVRHFKLNEWNRGETDVYL